MSSTTSDTRCEAPAAARMAATFGKKKWQSFVDSLLLVAPNLFAEPGLHCFFTLQDCMSQFRCITMRKLHGIASQVSGRMEYPYPYTFACAELEVQFLGASKGVAPELLWLGGTGELFASVFSRIGCTPGLFQWLSVAKHGQQRSVTSIYLPTWPFLYLSIYLYSYLSIYPSIYLSMCMYSYTMVGLQLKFHVHPGLMNPRVCI